MLPRPFCINGICKIRQYKGAVIFIPGYLGRGFSIGVSFLLSFGWGINLSGKSFNGMHNYFALQKSP